MKVKKSINGFSATARVMVLCLAALWVPVTAYAQTTPPRSYYVRANGDDNNNGRSEDAPFKTLAKAVDATRMGIIKQITVIGKIEERREIGYTGGNDEILITGKPDAVAGEKAEITSRFSISNTKIRFTHVSFPQGLSISRSNVTLGARTLVSGQISSRDSGTLTMIDDATVSGSNNGGISIGGYDNFTLTMSDNAEISGNTTDRAGGGISASSDATLTLTMSGNARIINNTAGDSGGGIYAERGQITLSGNARISGNTAGRAGGGIYANVRVELTIRGGEISGNTAKNGGGVFLLNRSSATMTGGTITGNKAEYGAGVCVQERAAFTLNGGAITGNEADFVGGGVYVQSGGTYTAGRGTVTGNTAGDGGDNVFRQ
ncbi:MAG: hypothetical protein LBL70_04875 [Treponema sp.]|jgi:predicted outer membrane repeat protein|nr:hypothetical protein [Treponema sp.]